MAFFASSQQELFEHRLRRSSSTASIRFRSRRPSGSQKSLPRSHISSPSHPLPSASTPDDIPSAQHNPSPTTLPSFGAKSRTTPLHARVISMKYYSMSIATLLTCVLFAQRFKIYNPHQSRHNRPHHRALPSARMMLLARLMNSMLCSALTPDCRSPIPTCLSLPHLFRARN